MAIVHGVEVADYYNRHVEGDGRNMVLFREGMIIQASEHNEVQSIISDRIKRVGSAIFADGDLISGGAMNVDKENATCSIAESQVYLKGDVWTVPAASLAIDVNSTVQIGVKITETVVSPAEDASLLNIAKGSRGEGEEGAWRVVASAEWAVAVGAEENFYPVFTVERGEQLSKETPPSFDAVNTAIAQYDQDSTGSGTYVSSGMVVASLGNTDDGEQEYNISAGRYRVAGYGYTLQTDRVVFFDTEPDTKRIETETAVADGTASQRIDVAHTPIADTASITVSVPRNATATISHTLGSDTIASGISVIRINSVSAGGTTYTQGTDYALSGSAITWLSSGLEPSAGTTVTVDYDYYSVESPASADYDGFTIDGTAVSGSTIIYKYSYALSRIDRLCVDGTGRYVWITGVSAERNPKTPAVPSNLLALATVYQAWRDAEDRTVSSDSIRAVAFDDLYSLMDRCTYLTEELARTRLENDAATREAGARVGMFVDPLLDDSMRDEGVTQTAAVVDGVLMLPIAAEMFDLTNITAPVTLDMTSGVDSSLTQTLRTGEMPVNPYQAFDPLPAKISLSPASDRWTESVTKYASTVTRYFTGASKTVNYAGSSSYKKAVTAAGGSVTSLRTGSSYTYTTSSTSYSTSVIGSSTGEGTYMRSRSVSFTVNGFGSGETLSSVTFAGKSVTFTAGAADSTGRLTGSFTIPSNITVGTKSVIFVGAGGSMGETAYTGTHTITYTTLQTVKNVTTSTTRLVYVDPLAQTFSVENALTLTGVDLWFTKKGGNPVKVNLVATSNGYPTGEVLATGTVAAAQISVGTWTRIGFDFPTAIAANTQYAIVVMTDDATTACGIAEIGKYDSSAQKWVTTQPYSIGVLLSSSNNSTWTAHQDRDLAFRLVKGTVTANSKTVELGTVAVSGATDLILYSASQVPDGTCAVSYTLTLPDNSTVQVDDDQSVELTSAVTGNIKVTARLTSEGALTPYLAEGAQLMVGTQASEGTYVTRSMSAVGASSCTVIYNAYVPSGATVKAELKKDDGAWTELTSPVTTNQGSGVYEYKYTASLSSVDLVKLRITLTGTAAARPLVGAIRMLSMS